MRNEIYTKINELGVIVKRILSAIGFGMVVVIIVVVDVVVVAAAAAVAVLRCFVTKMEIKQTT